MIDINSIFLFAPFVFIAFMAGMLIGYFSNYVFKTRVVELQNQGERFVREVITSNFKAPHSYLLNNITLPSLDGTTQIDHILVSTKGVFVIETKQYSGWIFGDEKSKQWTQVLYRVKSKFQNPIHQNFKHVKTIQEQLNFLPKEQVHSVVVFVGDAEFKTQVPKNVVHLPDLVSYIRNFNEDVISLNRVEFCVGRLECKRYEITRQTDVEHRAYLHEKFGKL
jgi:restriction system protein